jgi:predicted GNAT family acetyltransferase
MDSAVQNEKSYHRFAVHLGDATAVLAYKEEGDTIYLVHTEVPAEMEGKGTGGQLAKAALNYARENGLKVVARCPFVTSYLQRHPEYQDLVAGS